MKTWKKIVIGVICLLIGIISFIIIDTIVEENKLDKIVENMEKTGKVNMKIETNSLKSLEKAIKNDYKDFYDLLDKLENEYGNPIFENCLSAENIKKDGPNFIDTKKELENVKTSRKEINDKMKNIVSNKNVNDKIEKYNLKEDGSDINYKEYIKILKQDINETIKEDEKFNSDIDNSIKIFDFLEENYSHYTVEDNKILFDSKQRLDKYNWLVEKVCENCNTKSDI